MQPCMTVLSGILFLSGCYASISPGGDGEPGDLRHDDPSHAEPAVDPFVDPSSDPWYDPWPDSPACPPGLTFCTGVCVDLMIDMSNCGACGLSCPPAGVCVTGICIVTDPCEGILCPDGLSCCDGECVDLRRDPWNCGVCGNDCPWGTPMPDLNRDACMNPDLHVYTICCDGSCQPVSNSLCGDCEVRCDEGSSCSGLWDATTESCEMFACWSIFSGSIGSSCTSPEDCVRVPGTGRACLTDLMGMVAFEGGYCTAICTSQEDCGEGANCVNLMMASYCLKLCRTGDECRTDEGYQCAEIPFMGDGNTYCIPL
jgi:hypothetical protein